MPRLWAAGSAAASIAVACPPPSRRAARVVADVPTDVPQRRGEPVSDRNATEIGRSVDPPQRGARNPAWPARRVLLLVAHDSGDVRLEPLVGLPPAAPLAQITPHHRVVTRAALVGEFPHRREEGLAYDDGRSDQRRHPPIVPSGADAGPTVCAERRRAEQLDFAVAPTGSGSHRAGRATRSSAVVRRRTATSCRSVV